MKLVVFEGCSGLHHAYRRYVKRATAAVRALVAVDRKRMTASEKQVKALTGKIAELRSALASQIDRVELNPLSERCVIHYRLTTGVNLASPRGFEPRLPP